MSAAIRVSLSLCIAALWGCSESGEPPLDANACSTFETTLSVKDRMDQPVTTFNLAEDVTFSLRIANTRNEPATLTAGSSCTAVVFEVFDAAKQRQWGSADGIACIQMLQPRTYQPYESVMHSATWQQQGANNTAVTAGAYTVTANVGQFVTDAAGRQHDCRAALSKSATFTLQ